MPSLLVRLFDIAYVSRFPFSLLISVAFMLADVHFRVELQFEARFIQPEEVLELEVEAPVEDQ